MPRGEDPDTGDPAAGSWPAVCLVPSSWCHPPPGLRKGTSGQDWGHRLPPRSPVGSGVLLLGSPGSLRWDTAVELVPWEGSLDARMERGCWALAVLTLRSWEATTCGFGQRLWEGQRTGTWTCLTVWISSSDLVVRRAAWSRCSPLPTGGQTLRASRGGCPERGTCRLHGMGVLRCAWEPGLGSESREHGEPPFHWDPGLVDCKPGWAGLWTPPRTAIQMAAPATQPRGLLGMPGFAHVRK